MTTANSTKPKVMFTSAYPISNVNFGPNWLVENANDDFYNKYEHTDNPVRADVIVFVENHPGDDPFFFAVMFGALYQKYKNKVILYHDSDDSVAFCRTITPSIQIHQYNSKSKISLHYIARINDNHGVNNVNLNQIKSKQRPYLFSFVGHSSINKTRHEILKLKYDDCLVSDSDYYNVWNYSNKKRGKYESVYVNSILDSKFVLCPKGNGPATYRLFETMQLGRVPVIVSDNWMPIQGIEWKTCSITVREAEINMIPSILEKNEKYSYEMGLKAREVWENYFSPEVSALRLADAAIELSNNRYGYSELLFDVKQVFYPKHFKTLQRYLKRKFIVNREIDHDK